MQDIPRGQLVTLTVLSAFYSLVTATRGLITLTNIHRQVHEGFETPTVVSKYPNIFLVLWYVCTFLGTVSTPILAGITWHVTSASNSPGRWPELVPFAAIVSSIVAERLSFSGFFQTVSKYQHTLICMSATGVVLLIAGQLSPWIPQPIIWIITGCAIHRISMVATWYIISIKSDNTGRIYITPGAHTVALGATFLAFLGGFNSLLTRLLFLSTMLLVLDCVPLIIIGERLLRRASAHLFAAKSQTSITPNGTRILEDTGGMNTAIARSRQDEYASDASIHQFLNYSDDYLRMHESRSISGLSNGDSCASTKTAERIQLHNIDSL